MRKFHRALSILISSVVSTAMLVPPAAARDSLPAPGVYLGIYGGGNLALTDDWNLHSNSQLGVTPKHGLVGGLRLGFQFNHWLALELGAAVLPLSSDNGGDALALSYRGDFIISPWRSAWSPHLLVGGGAYHLVSGDWGDDIDWHAQWGLGVRGMLTDWMNLRVEARHVLTDSFTDALAQNVELQLGLDFWLSGGDSAPSDTDGDGIPDKKDSCPTEYGHASAQGCPDRDGDSIIDSQDLCPDQPGLVEFNGCADRDGDGIPDNTDQCPTVAGFKEFAGCLPPDRDGDGVPDSKDKCPNDPGPADTQGCPDRDGDGVIDIEDKCPDEAGVPEEKGCLPAQVRRRFSGSVKGINFETGSAAIKKNSFKLLDDAAATFTKYSRLRVEIEGHTDDQGDDGFNMTLSQQRADAVRDYLINKGVDAERLKSVGYGEDRPVANNKSAAGRAKNRRIEFKILGRGEGRPHHHNND